MQEFNYANVEQETQLVLRENETIQYINEKPYLCWHDLIDVRVPLFTDPSLLHCPRVPLPLHFQNPRSILTKIDKDWWDRTRKRVYESQQRHCACCGVHQSKQKGYIKNQLDAHELYNIDYKTGKVELFAIVSLCKWCHNSIHFGRLTAQYEAGKIQDKVYYGIISHANSILRQNNLPPKNWDATIDDNIYQIPWDKWHLELTINGEKQQFYSLFKDEAELLASY